MILLVNGPNLNLLGEREPEIYGRTTLADIEQMVVDACAGWAVQVKAFQSNHEGALLDFIQEHRAKARGLILNLGALTHTSYALHDCLKALSVPAVEVHISNIHAREGFRHTSLTAPACRGVIAGLGPRGYILAAEWLCAEIGALPREQAERKARTT
ncbi:type II 3-dehydroquinate dehydratase [Anaeromyxobacter oryzae]|uniref:3-dehydroquinate dehydratase n=1 Tax=Anaeromyxobacter oryzae TaxID=2918170 RepID=A0ABM7WWE7_9BACT|nr:type II 3-dehydroquinate dehydratase [Anaeromyxobacter oryzae]BDG03739.1 3-dehydroquinate dehydratase 1 [Anaeromyxobacter oryzae]